MKNSSLTRILFITALIPLAAVLAALPFLPDEIPAHYDFNMNVDRWGSKYESMLIPAATILMAAFMYAMSRFAGKQENGESNEKVLLISGSAVNLLFTAMTAWSLVLDFREVNGMKISSNTPVKVIFICLGIVMAVTGNFMPKCKLNSIVGLRTKWSMANEDVWFKCQRFGGALYVICGISMALLSAVMESNTAVFAAAMTVSAVLILGSAVGSKVIHDRMKK